MPEKMTVDTARDLALKVLNILYEAGLSPPETLYVLRLAEQPLMVDLDEEGMVHT